MSKKQDWFEDDCPLCQQLKQDIENGLAEGVEWGHFEWEEDEDEEEETDLDRDSIRASKLIASKHYDEAETLARRLMKNYPEEVDGIQRLAEVYEARGDTARAIQYYESALAFTYVYEGFDGESRDYYREQIEELKKTLV